ncbi:SDR family oxidoreductase [bacterium]|nr:SDR family oxidoreductase [candidate division CSSED10-310 bacterium]
MSDTILITGAAKRLGLVMATAAARRGLNVAIHYRSGSQQAETAAAAIREIGVNAVAVQAELTDAAKVQRMFDVIEQAMGNIRYLINSASIFSPCALMDTEMYEFEHFISVNLVAQYQVTRCFVRSFKSDGGAIVNMLDWRAWKTDPWFLAYNVAKAGLLNMTVNLAVDLAPKIRVNGVAPGAILPHDHENVRSRPEAKGIPIDRWGTPDEVAEAVMFLLLDAHYITGQVVTVDGGKHLT